jgi:hypothetical protein
MTVTKAEKLISEAMEELKKYNSKEKSMYGDIRNMENNIQKGRELLLRINRGELFEDEDGRVPQVETLVGEEPIEELRCELKKTSEIVKRLKGDILLK